MGRKPKEYPVEFMETIRVMSSKGESPSRIKETLKFMFPSYSICEKTIERIRDGIEGSREVKSSQGNSSVGVKVKLCKEVIDFLDNLPIGVNMNSLINSILLMYIRQCKLREERLAIERTKEVEKRKELNEKTKDAHYIPIDGSEDFY